MRPLAEDPHQTGDEAAFADELILRRNEIRDSWDEATELSRRGATRDRVETRCIINRMTTASRAARFKGGEDDNSMDGIFRMIEDTQCHE